MSPLTVTLGMLGDAVFNLTCSIAIMACSGWFEAVALRSTPLLSPALPPLPDRSR